MISGVESARSLATEGAVLVGLNCEQEPARMLPILREMRKGLPATARLAAQPAAFRTTDAKPYFTGLPEFPDAMETIQVTRAAFTEFTRAAKAEGVAYLGGCCGCNAAYIRALARGLRDAPAPETSPPA
ncbi:MAG: homocysteine S-methyltransferase family protein [bacterium]